jgi:hypothetical protein
MVYSPQNVVFERLEKVLVKEKLGVEDLKDEEVKAYAALLARQQLRTSVDCFWVASEFLFLNSSMYWQQLSLLAFSMTEAGPTPAIGGLTAEETRAAQTA